VYCKYGSYQHAANEVAITVNRTALRADNGVIRATRVSIGLRGRYQADTQAGITSGLSGLEAAYTDGRGDFGLYLDDGTLTQHYIRAADTAGGIRIMKAVSYPVGDSAEYVTYRNFEVELEADVLTDVGILDWRETITVSGGGPMVIWLEPLNGAPQAQLVKQQTTYKATQSGSATGHLGPVTPPDPLWPAFYQKNKSSASSTSGKRNGPRNAPFYTDFVTTWNYAFESNIPFEGNPTLQPEA